MTYYRRNFIAAGNFFFIRQSLTQHIDELRTAFRIAVLALANGRRTFSKVMGFARAQAILRAASYSRAVSGSRRSQRTQLCSLPHKGRGSALGVAAKSEV